jgi:hypothetical protein
MKWIALFLTILIFNSCQKKTFKVLDANIHEVNEVGEFQERVEVMKEEYKKALKKHLEYVEYDDNKDILMFHAFLQLIDSTNEVILPQDYNIKFGDDYTEQELFNHLNFSLGATTIVVIDGDQLAYVSTTLTSKKEEANIYEFNPMYQKILAKFKEKEYEFIFTIMSSGCPCFWGYNKGQVDIYMYSKSIEKYQLIDFGTFKEKIE